MPLTSKGNEIMAAMKKEYGEEEGERVFYASKKAGKISGVDSDEEIAADSDNPIDLNIPDYARVHGALDSMAEQISSLGLRAAGVLRTLARGDADKADHLASARSYREKFAEHRKIGRGMTVSLHTAAMSPNELAARYQERAAAVVGTPAYVDAVKEANKVAEAAERASKRAYLEEPNGPVRKIPQL